jgi:hypothetical protein
VKPAATAHDALIPKPEVVEERSARASLVASGNVPNRDVAQRTVETVTSSSECTMTSTMKKRTLCSSSSSLERPPERCQSQPDVKVETVPHKRPRTRVVGHPTTQNPSNVLKNSSKSLKEHDGTPDGASSSSAKMPTASAGPSAQSRKAPASITFSPITKVVSTEPNPVQPVAVATNGARHKGMKLSSATASLEKSIERQKFEAECVQILESLPKNYRELFGQIGFCPWGRKRCPALILSPFDIPPGSVRHLWLEMYNKVSPMPIFRVGDYGRRQGLLLAPIYSSCF